MAKLRVKNFGPIKDGFSENDGFMEITPVTVICGNQATGKSTIAKLYSTFLWLEKALIRMDFDANSIDSSDFQDFCRNQGIEEFFTANTEIYFVGNAYKFSYWDGLFYVSNNEEKVINYHRPKIMYIPSERNLITVLENVDKLKNLPVMLSVLFDEYKIAMKTLAVNGYDLPVSNVKVKYDSEHYVTKVITSDNASVSIKNASSGIQSIVPLSLVSKFLSQEVISDIYKNIQRLSSYERDQIKDFIKKTYSDNKNFVDALLKELNMYFLTGKKIDSTDENIPMLKSLLCFYFNTCFINIVEEPEQNLYPESQGKVLYELLECLNTNEHNQLIITTHSPYMLSYLTQSAKAAELLGKGVPSDRIEKIVPVKSAVASGRISIYETKEDGSIALLKPYEKLPSDENLLNTALADGNERFSKLLDLEVAFCK